MSASVSIGHFWYLSEAKLGQGQQEGIELLHDES
jgi:hypothetical protein